jgi:hypothetical protein
MTPVNLEESEFEPISSAHHSVAAKSILNLPRIDNIPTEVPKDYIEQVRMILGDQFRDKF